MSGHTRLTRSGLLGRNGADERESGLGVSTTGTTITSTATDLKYTVIDDGTALTTVGDNEIHFANNATTGGVDIRYDTNKSAGTTALSDIIHLDGITGIDLSKTDFTFV